MPPHKRAVCHALNRKCTFPKLLNWRWRMVVLSILIQMFKIWERTWHSRSSIPVTRCNAWWQFALFDRSYQIISFSFKNVFNRQPNNFCFACMMNAIKMCFVIRVFGSQTEEINPAFVPAESASKMFQFLRWDAIDRYFCRDSWRRREA